MPVDEDKLMAFMGQAVTDMAATVSTALAMIGDKLGIYKAMAGAGPLSSAEVAERCGLAERYVREWLANSGGRRATSPTTRRPRPTSSSPSRPWRSPTSRARSSLGGAFDVIAACWAGEEQITEAFRTGKGVGWHEHAPAPVRRDRAILPPRLSRVPHLVRLDPRAQRRRGQAPRGAKRRRRRLRPRGVDHHHGAGLSEVDRFGVRLPPGVDRHRAQARGRGRGGRTASRSRSPTRRRLPRHRLRPRLLLRLPPRHGRSRRRRPRTRERRWPRGAPCSWSSPSPPTTLESNLNPMGRSVLLGVRRSCARPRRSPRTSGSPSAPRPESSALRDVFTEAGYAGFHRATETPFNLILEATP